MKEYFLLQYKMTNRKLIEFGVEPVIAYVLGAVCFTLASRYLFDKTEFAKYIVLLTALALSIQASSTRKTEFLTLTFGSKKSRQIRIAENVILSLPFLILLLYRHAFAESAMLVVGIILSAGFSFKNNFNYAIPTPFYRKPFEFTAGFRNTFYIFPMAYVLTIIAISVGNMNLGIFAMLFVFAIALSYYKQPENEYFVWSYAATPSKFIFDKIKTATVYIAFLALPIALFLICFYPHETATILLFALMGFAFLWAVILAKYAAYPREINFPEGILIAICIYFPPLLFALIPYFYRKSIKKLNLLLK
ncbi:MAG TPA: hypothetical protein VK476_02520 [Flavobacterium sp.]|nr:hypothetical protein [Flavobacterium sp.]